MRAAERSGPPNLPEHLFSLTIGELAIDSPLIYTVSSPKCDDVWVHPLSWHRYRPDLSRDVALHSEVALQRYVVGR